MDYIFNQYMDLYTMGSLVTENIYMAVRIYKNHVGYDVKYGSKP
jgi:hypothetical protein